MTEPKRPRTGGRQKTLPDAHRTTVHLTEAHRDIVREYALKHRITDSEAIRRAIELLKEN